MPIIKNSNFSNSSIEKLISKEIFNSAKFASIPIENIYFYKNLRNMNSFEDYNDQNLNDLIESIRTNGLLEPILVNFNSKDNKYYLISGHRRLIACKNLKHSNINCCIFYDIDDDTFYKIQIAENIHREDLKNSEVKNFIVNLYQKGYSLRDIANYINKSHTYVNNFLKIHNANIDDNVLDSNSYTTILLTLNNKNSNDNSLEEKNLDSDNSDSSDFTNMIKSNKSKTNNKNKPEFTKYFTISSDNYSITFKTIFNNFDEKDFKTKLKNFLNKYFSDKTE